MTETIHATCVAIAGRGVLLCGRPGSGKSDLALRLMDRGAALVADDRCAVAVRDGRPWASAPARIAGLLEVRGVGIVPAPALPEAPVALLVDLEVAPERLPERAVRDLAGCSVPLAALAPFEASAPIKVELLLKAIPA